MDDRRAFLRFLAASPLYAGLPWARAALAQTPEAVEAPVARAQDALDVFDLQKVAQHTIPPAHWGYLMTGVDGEETLKANREAYARWELRTRRLVDLSKMDMGIELFGNRYASPIFLCPLGYQRAFNPDGEVGVARAAKARNALQILSTVSSSSIDDVIKARGAPIWYQLYTTNNLDVAVKLVKQAEAAGAAAVAMTIDLPVGRNTETSVRLARSDTRTCTSCHGPAGPTMTGRPMFANLGLSGPPLVNSTPSLTWDFIRRLKDATKMKVLVKGLESGDDAALAVKYGCDGVMVSNHGGRATETGRGTLESLPEVVAAVKGRIPVLVDGGVRRGTDALKALALGATAVGIGRPYIWGLGAFGQPGVERTLDVLNNELRLAMGGVGARTIREITPAALIRRI
ncbi:MAG TPA: alpha-hydroxy acid oxidase [Phenylobacterium sp.]|jgi:isopentenyl diphosphate isomerase/L-lactate dehydrogenase-like FMN-dependent dehydrogenase|uniref:alpha-hydroxy acid oxidase n=1 Tax=Phenylobacterium sp. TaxID=1871053 RepID=UPI002D513CDB|nr:alpha-hydroxy acid oxidase [Phenylobacterium sp.]HZZ67214.1 alpha-hydroxy acid oxidase [Phenylobacterium sp.]